MQLYRSTGIPISRADAVRDNIPAYWRPVDQGAWAVEMNKILRPRLLRSPLVPSLIVETRHHYQVYFVAKNPLAENRRAVVEERLVPYFSATTRDLMPAPGTTGAAIRWRHEVGYTEQQMARAFAWRGSARPVLELDASTEAKALGALILRNDLLSAVPGLEVDDFSDLRHKVVFQAVRNLESRGEEIGVVSLESEIEHQGKLDAVGGIAFLGLLVAESAAAATLTADHVQQWAVRLRAVRVDVEAAIAKEDERIAATDAEQSAIDIELDEFALRDVG